MSTYLYNRTVHLGLAGESPACIIFHEGMCTKFDENRRAWRGEKWECRTLCAIIMNARAGGEGKTPVTMTMTLSRSSLSEGVKAVIYMILRSTS